MDFTKQFLKPELIRLLEKAGFDKPLVQRLKKVTEQAGFKVKGNKKRTLKGMTTTGTGNRLEEIADADESDFSIVPIDTPQRKKYRLPPYFKSIIRRDTNDLQTMTRARIVSKLGVNLEQPRPLSREE